MSERAVTGYARAWLAAAGDPVEYERLAAVVTAQLHTEFPNTIPREMAAPPRAAILKRLLKL